jgi:hypothetical protein
MPLALWAHHAAVLRIYGKWKHRGIEGRMERQVAPFGTVSDAVRPADQRGEPLARSELLDEGEHPEESFTRPWDRTIGPCDLRPDVLCALALRG